MFFPRIVKEFNFNGICSTKVGGIVGKTADNYSIVSIPTSKAFSDFITCWSKDNLVTYQNGDKVPVKLFCSSVDNDQDKPWIPSLNPITLFRIPTSIIKLKEYCTIIGSISKQSICMSLQSYCQTAVDWLDAIGPHKENLKNLTYTSFDSKYYPPGFQKKFTKEKTCTVQPIFEIDDDSPVYESVNKDISSIKTKN